MSDIKISQLNSVTSLNSADLFAISKSLGGGNWESKSISGLNLLHGLTASRILTVAPEGVVDATNIKDAVAIAVSMSPTEQNPIAIQVFPGSYYEENPITIPQWVSIYSQGGQYAAGIAAKNEGVIFNTSGNNDLNGFSIMGDVSYSNIAYKSSTTMSGLIRNCIIINCYTGILSDNGSILANYVTGLSFQRVFNSFISAINGGFISATECNLTGIMTNPVYGYYSYGSGSELYLFSCAASNCVNALYVNNIGYIDCFSGHFGDCTNAVNIGPTGASSMRCVSTIIEDSISNDILIESPTSSLAFIGSFDSSKFSIVSGATFNSSATDNNPYTQGVSLLSAGQMSSWGTLNIGTPGAIELGKDTNVNIGEGRAFIADQYGNLIVEFWSYNDTAPSGSKFTRFTNNAGTQLTGANDAIIVGCKYQFPAIRLNVNVAMGLVSPTDYLVTEYWNGSTWVDLSPINSLGGGGVACYKRSDYTRRNHNLFRHVETEFVECSSELNDNGDWNEDIDVLDQVPNWDANEPFYAIRFRNQQTLASGMQFTDGRIKPNSFVFSSSGQQVNFGVYRTDRSLYVDSSALSNDIVYPASFVNLQVSPSISFADVPIFLKANSISRMSLAFTMPYDIDTASPLHVYADGIAVSSASGNIVSTIHVARIDAKNPPASIPITEVEIGPIITAMPGVANGYATIEQPLDISGYNAEDTLFIAFSRLASDGDDDYSGDFILGDITFKYKGKFV